MRDFLIIKDPEVAKLLADPNRRDILHNLRCQEMTPHHIAKILGKNVSSISYHLNALEKAGLVEQSRTSVKGNLIEKFYRATARVFIISYTLSEGFVPGSEDIAKWSKEICKQAVSSLEAFGYEISDKEMNRWLKPIEKYASMENVAYEDVILRQIRPTNIGRPALQLILNLLAHVHLYRNPEYLKILKEISQELNKKEKKISLKE